MGSPNASCRIENGMLCGARACLSPNANARPQGCVPSLVVVHGISLPPGEYGGRWIDDLFLNQLAADAHPAFAPIASLQVSAHVLIRRDGSDVQYVPFHRRAWHSGVSVFMGEYGCNDFSIGIELEGCDADRYTAPQYQRLAAVCRALQRAYPAIRRDRIVGHSDISPGRKTDPGPFFDWSRLMREMDSLDIS